MNDFGKAVEGLKQAIYKELEPLLLPIVKWLARLLK